MGSALALIIIIAALGIFVLGLTLGGCEYLNPQLARAKAEAQMVENQYREQELILHLQQQEAQMQQNAERSAALTAGLATGLPNLLTGFGLLLTFLGMGGGIYLAREGFTVTQRGQVPVIVTTDRQASTHPGAGRDRI